MRKLMGKHLNPTQLAIVYKQVVAATNGTEASRDRELLKRIIMEEYEKAFPDSYMPIDNKEDTLISIYTNYGRVEQLANELGIADIEELLRCIQIGFNAQHKEATQQEDISK